MRCTRLCPLARSRLPGKAGLRKLKLVPIRHTYLFSVDLEDVRFAMADGRRYRERVPRNAHAYLEWLRKHKFTCTFFVVSDVAEAYQSLIQEIASEGHELACHGYRHVPLDQQSPEAFKRDTALAIETLLKTGAKSVEGIRAPVFSMTEATQDRYPIMESLGFTYSSSVLPARNPLYGWKAFGEQARLVGSRLVEIPMTVARVGPLTVPFAGGIYFRNLPELLIARHAKRHRRSGDPLSGYFHPYDIDTEQEHFMHPGIKNSRVFNALMYRNRQRVFHRLDTLIAHGFSVSTYRDHVARCFP
jgi:polysaccharide deacetylase family protein (PEP-CTERM system associated)